MAPAATITSLLADAVYRVEPPLAGANSTPDAVIGIAPLAQLILVTYYEKCESTSAQLSRLTVIPYVG